MKFNKGRPFPAPLFRFCVSCRLAKGNSGSWEATDETHGWWTGGPEMSPWNFLWNQSLAFQCLKKKRGQLLPPKEKQTNPSPPFGMISSRWTLGRFGRPFQPGRPRIWCLFPVMEATHTASARCEDVSTEAEWWRSPRSDNWNDEMLGFCASPSS